MDSLTIDKLLHSTSKYLGTFAKNEIYNQTLPKLHGIIVNTQNRSEPGEHWVAFYKDVTGYCEYFDPYGLPPLHNEFVDFLNLNSECCFGWNNKQLQCITCITCGYYCVLYISYRCNGYTINDFLSNFTTDTYVNDDIIKNEINNLML